MFSAEDVKASVGCASDGSTDAMNVFVSVGFIFCCCLGFFPFILNFKRMAGPSIALNLVIQRQLTRLSEFIRDMFSDELLGLSLVLLFFILYILFYIISFNFIDLFVDVQNSRVAIATRQ